MSKNKHRHKIRKKRYLLRIYRNSEFIQDIFIIKNDRIQLVGRRNLPDRSHGPILLGKVWKDYDYKKYMREPTLIEINSVVEWLPKNKWIK